MPSPAKATNLAKRRLQKVLTKSKKRKRNWAEPCESDILQNAAKATKTLHRSLISKFSLKIAEFFADILLFFPECRKFCQNFAEFSPNFDQNFSGFFQNAEFH